MRISTKESNDKQVITLKKLDVDIIDFRKLANRCEI